MEIHLPKIYFRPTFLHAGTRATEKEKKDMKVLSSTRQLRLAGYPVPSVFCFCFCLPFLFFRIKKKKIEKENNFSYLKKVSHVIHIRNKEF